MFYFILWMQLYSDMPSGLRVVGQAHISTLKPVFLIGERSALLVVSTVNFYNTLCTEEVVYVYFITSRTP